MPQIGKMKFPYTKAGKDRYQAIKKQLGGAKQAATMYPTNPPRPGRPSRPGRPGFGIRPFPQNYRPKPPNRKYK